MKRDWVGILCVGLITQCLLLSAHCCCPPWAEHIGIEGTGGNFRKGGGADAFVPLRQNGVSILFAQGGGGRFHDVYTVNFGAGYRKMLTPQFAVGANVFGDLASSDSGHPYAQVGVGVEVFGCRWLARANGYLPTTRRHFLNSRTSLEGLALTRRDLFERAYPGVDCEAGYEVPIGPGHLWGYGGLYYYELSHEREFFGPRARVEYRLDRAWPIRCMEWIASVDYEYDHVHGHTVSGYGGVRLFFGKHTPAGCLSPLCRYMGRKVWRNRGIWVEGTRVDETSQLIFANNTIDGIGTQTDPALLPVALSKLNPGDVIFMLNDTGQMTTNEAMLIPTDAQMLGFGDAASRLVFLPTGAIRVFDLTGDGRASVAPGGGTTVLMDAPSGAFICGITMNDADTAVRMLAGIDNVKIEDVNFEDQLTQAIFNDGGGRLTVTDSDISNAATGVRGLATRGDIIVKDTTIAAVTSILYNIPADGALRVDNITTTDTVGINVTQPRIVRVTNSSFTSALMSYVNNDMTPVGPEFDTRLLSNTMTTFMGIAIRPSTVPNTSNVLVVDGNTVTTTGMGVFVDLTFMPISTFDVVMSNNPTIIGDGFGIFFLQREGVTSDISNNTITTTAVGGIGLSHTTSSAGTTTGNDGTIASNVVMSAGGGNGYAFIGTAGGGLPITCATIAGNNRIPSLASDIDFSSFSTPDFRVFDFSGGAAGLSATNNGITVTVSAGAAPAANAVACPLPVIPPAP